MKWAAILGKIVSRGEACSAFCLESHTSVLGSGPSVRRTALRLDKVVAPSQIGILLSYTAIIFPVSCGSIISIHRVEEVPGQGEFIVWFQLTSQQFFS